MQGFGQGQKKATGISACCFTWFHPKPADRDPPDRIDVLAGLRAAADVGLDLHLFTSSLHDGSIAQISCLTTVLIGFLWRTLGDRSLRGNDSPTRKSSRRGRDRNLKNRSPCSRSLCCRCRLHPATRYHLSLIHISEPTRP